MVQGAQVTDGRFKADPMAVLQTVTNNPLLTREEVGRIHGITSGRVSQLCTKYGINKDELADFKDNRADIFANLQRVITESLTVDEIKKAPAASRVLMLCQIYDKERLERGQSTENVLNVNVVKTLDERSRSLQEAMQALSGPQDVVSSPDNACIPRDNVTHAVDDKSGEMQAIDITATNDAVSDNISYVNLRENVRDTGQGEPGQRRKGRPRKG